MIIIETFGEKTKRRTHVEDVEATQQLELSARVRVTSKYSNGRRWCAESQPGIWPSPAGGPSLVCLSPPPSFFSFRGGGGGGCNKHQRERCRKALQVGAAAYRRSAPYVLDSLRETPGRGALPPACTLLCAFCSNRRLKTLFTPSSGDLSSESYRSRAGFNDQSDARDGIGIGIGFGSDWSSPQIASTGLPF